MTDRVVTKGHTIELFVQYTDSIGNPIATDITPSVEVTDSGGTITRTLNKAGVSSITDSLGLYKFTYEIPVTNTNDGYWLDRHVALIGGETVENTFQFLVLDGGGIAQDVDFVPTPGDDFEFTFTADEVEGINKLLSILKKRLKSDGVRKVPDGLGGYVEETCVIFSTDELTCFLINSLSEFNQWPHFTRFTFADVQIQDTFLDIIVQGAVLLALAAQSLIEKGREFTITDNGITYQPPQVSEILNSQYGTQLGYYKEKLRQIKNSLKPGPRSLASWRVSAINPRIRALRHMRSRRLV